jgi:splicing factor 3A subunit 3
LFSGEEGYGKYLDLYANHTAYNNLKNIGKRPGYLQYLDLLLAAQDGPIHQDLSKETRFTKDFEMYVNFQNYLRIIMFNLLQLHSESSCISALLR